MHLKQTVMWWKKKQREQIKELQRQVINLTNKLESAENIICKYSKYKVGDLVSFQRINYNYLYPKTECSKGAIEKVSIGYRGYDYYICGKWTQESDVVKKLKCS